MTTQVIIRINPELKDKVGMLARSEGKSVSVIVRELLEDYVNNRDIGSYIDGLWDRIGGKLESRGAGRGDIDLVIKKVRSGK